MAIHPRSAPDPKAFAIGATRNSALVAVSASLLNQMKPNEVEAVLAHEIGHVVDRTILGNRQGHGIGYFITSLVAQVVLGILASTIVCWFSRQREFRADAAGVRLSGKENMIAALERLQNANRQPSSMPTSMAAFGIRTGVRGGNLARLFSTHPPLEDRIAALRLLS